MSQRKCPETPLPTSNHTPRRRAARTSGRIRPASSSIPFGGGANMWVTMSPRLSSGKSFESGDAVWPMWIITTRPDGPATSAVRRSTS
jgi:hypothetical protein